MKKDNLIITLQEDVNFRLKCSYFYNDFHNCIYLSYNDALTICSNIKISDIVVNNLAGYENIIMTLSVIEQMKKISNAKVSFRGHDFQCFCPNITLVNYNDSYCNCKNLDCCSLCILKSKNVLIKTHDVKKYQNAWHHFLKYVADEIIVFSQSTYDILSHAYSGLENKFKIIPHQIPNMKKVNIQPHNGLNICVIGNISPAKGAKILKEMDKILPNYNDINLFLAGKIGFKPKKIKLLGAYNLENLPSLMENNFIDIILIPSIWPETFSYTTEEAMTMGLPVACYNLGAPAERVRNYKMGLILSKMDAKQTLDEIADFMHKNLSSF